MSSSQPYAYHRTRIVSLSPSVTETLFALGRKGSKLSASPNIANYPPTVLDTPEGGLPFLTPNIKAIVKAEANADRQGHGCRRASPRSNRIQGDGICEADREG